MGEVTSGNTRGGSLAASALLRIAGHTRKSVAVIRVNAYDDAARVVGNLQLQDKVIVRGELQTRNAKSGTTVTELKAHQVSMLN